MSSKISPAQAKALASKSAATASATKTNAPAAAAPKVAVKPQAKAVLKPAVKSTAKPVAAVKTATVKSTVAKAKVTKKVEDKKPKAEKVKMERDSFTMPKDEYAQIATLKSRLTAAGQPVKKSELLRAGIKLLAAMSDSALKTTLASIPVIKTGRPNKKD